MTLHTRRMFSSQTYDESHYSGVLKQSDEWNAFKCLKERNAEVRWIWKIHSPPVLEYIRTFDRRRKKKNLENARKILKRVAVVRGRIISTFAKRRVSFGLNYSGVRRDILHQKRAWHSRTLYRAILLYWITKEDFGCDGNYAEDFRAV